MDTQLQELLERIKTEGVAEAEKLAERITREAEAEAKRIVTEARESVEALESQARRRTERLEEASVQAITHASRDLLLALRQQIVRTYEAIIERDTAAALGIDLLKNVVTELVRTWVRDSRGEVEILLSEENLAACREHFDSALSAELRAGVEINPSPEVSCGFRVVEREGSTYFDFTEEGIAQHLAALLSPRIAEIVRQATNSDTA